MKRSPLKQMSEKRIAEFCAAGLSLASTFKPRTSAVPRQASGLRTSRSAGGASGESPGRGVVPMPRRSSRGPRPEPAVPADRRAELETRSDGWCEAGLDGCWGRATDPHHRVVRGIGGVHGEAKERADELADLVLLCRRCHQQVHAYPAASYALGLLLKRHQVPAQSLLWYRGEPSYLDNDGRVWSNEEVGA